MLSFVFNIKDYKLKFFICELTNLQYFQIYFCTSIYFSKFVTCKFHNFCINVPKLNSYPQIKVKKEMLKKVKDTIKGMDVFAQPATFRISQSPNYQSHTGGIVSIVMIIVFICIFASTVLNTINRKEITTKMTFYQEEDPSRYETGINNFMFAVGLENADLSGSKKWFDIYIDQKIATQGGQYKKTVHLNFTKCTKDLWVKLQPSMENHYDNLKMDTFLCPDQRTILNLQGKFSSDIFQYIKIGVKACTPTVGKTCANSTQIQQYLKTNEAFKLQFFYINSIINSDNQDYLSTYMDTSTYYLFTPTYGAIGNFYISSYSITTDNSILPWEQKSIDQGGITDNGATESRNYQVLLQEYVKFYIRKSSLSLTYDRSFRKADDCLSYIGGLFSTIIMLLFFLPKYNETCYELSVAQSSFHYQKNTPIKSQEFNFLTYLGYWIYSLLDSICITLPWEKMKRINQTLDQIQKQMDIRLILKKILYTERTTFTVFDQPKAKILHLQAPMTLKEVQQLRKQHRFYHKLEKKFFDYQKIREQQKLNQKRDIPAQSGEKQKLKEKPNIPAQPNQHQKYENDKKNQNNNEKENQIQNKNKRNSNQSIQSLQKNAQSRRELKIQKRKSLVQVIHTVLDDKTEKEKEFEQMFEEMKQNVQILEKDSERGDLMSQKILDKLDPKIIKILIHHKELENQQQLQLNNLGLSSEKKLISFQNGEYQFGDNPNSDSQIKIPNVI